MLHPLDRPIGSDLSQLVLEKRRRQLELGSQVLDSTNQRLYPLPSQLVEREAFIADRETVLDGELIPIWHFRGGRKGQR